MLKHTKEYFADSILTLSDLGSISDMSSSLPQFSQHLLFLVSAMIEGRVWQILAWHSTFFDPVPTTCRSIDNYLSVCSTINMNINVNIN